MKPIKNECSTIKVGDTFSKYHAPLSSTFDGIVQIVEIKNGQVKYNYLNEDGITRWGNSRPIHEFLIGVYYMER